MSRASEIVVAEAKWSLQAARILDLERQLAEAQAWENERDSYIESHDKACRERDEAHGKLKQIEAVHTHNHGCSVCAILGEKGA